MKHLGGINKTEKTLRWTMEDDGGENERQSEAELKSVGTVE